MAVVGPAALARLEDLSARVSRRLAKDWEKLNPTALAFLHHAAIRFTLRGLYNAT
jgi:hypothetical protein